MGDWLDILRREGVYLWYDFTVQLEQIAPYWVLGMALGSVISVLGKGRLHAAFVRLGQKRLGALGLIPASLLGIASPLCMYGTIPLAASFSRQGVRDDYLAAFMMASVLLNPQLMMYSTALGRTAWWIRIAACFLCGITAGALVRRFFRGKPFFRFDGFLEPVSRDTDPNPVLRLLKNLLRNVKATAPWFLLGVTLTALYGRYVPAEWAESLFGAEQGFGVLMAATLGVPMYMCGGGTIPLLQEWLWQGMSLGAAAAFMITGPATKLTNLSAMKSALGNRHFLLYLGFVLAFALTTGLAVNTAGLSS